MQKKYEIPPRRVLGHLQVMTMSLDIPDPANPWKFIRRGEALGFDRRECPGGMFEWQRLEEAGCALRRTPRKPDEPAAQKTIFDRLETHTVIARGTSSADVKAIKELLFDIGYWVAPYATTRANLTDGFDEAMFHAVRAFQTRTFSGRRRAYVIAPSQPAPPNPPGSEYGTLDQKTIKAIIETWLSL